MAGRRGLDVPQNTFLDSIIKKTAGAHENFLLGGVEPPDNPIVFCSEGFLKLFGYKKSQVLKKKVNCSFMYGSLTTKDAVRELRHALQDKTPTQMEIVFYKKDGTPFWVLLNVECIHDELDNVVMFLITFQDITEFKEPINPSFRKQRWSEFNKSLHAKPVPDNPISKAKEEKNRILIGQLMECRVDDLPEYKQHIPKTPWYVVLHCCKPKVVWDWFILVFILYTATSVPFIICFKYDDQMMTIADCVVDLMFMIDIILNFHTSYLDEESTIVLDLKKIRRRYFRGWFLVDLITSLPYGIISLLLPGMGTEITKFISFLKATRLLRLNRVVRALDQYLEYGFITLILWMLFFCLCAHWMACIFFAIADHYDNFADIGWVRAMSDATSQPLIVVNGTAVIRPTLASLYMSSLYFSLTSLTSIGFGNIAPNTTAEKIFSCITMIFGGLCYAVIFGQVTAIVQQSQKKSESYHQTLENMRAFCKLYKVPKEISTRIIDYYMYNWALSKGVDTNQVLLNCPKDVQSDICIHLNKKIIDSTPAFGELSNAVLRAIARNFAIHRVAPGERVVHEGETLDTIYFVASGSFEITRRGNIFGLVGEGDVFGDDVCRYSDVGKSASDVHALTYGDVHTIGRDDLMAALNFYPEYAVQFAKVFRISYNLRSELSPIKLRAGGKPFDLMGMSRRPSFVDEHHSADIGSTGLDLSTPSSQNMTDTDPPSKSFAFAKHPRPLDGITAISESSENMDSGLDDDFRQWSEFHTKKSDREELFNQITGMKSEVRGEIEAMGSKMNHLEQNIATILDLLKDKEMSSRGGRATASRATLHPMAPPGSSHSCRTATIIETAKAEIPEETLPDWVEMENFGMKESGRESKDMNNDLEIEDHVGAVKDEKDEGNEKQEEGKKEEEGGKKREGKKKDKKKGKKKKPKENKVVPVTETPPEDKEEIELNSSVDKERQPSGKSVRESSTAATSKSDRLSKFEDTVIDIDEENIAKANKDVEELASVKVDDTTVDDLDTINDAGKHQGDVEHDENNEAATKEERQASSKGAKSKKLRKSRTGESLVVSDLAKPSTENEKAITGSHQSVRPNSGEYGTKNMDDKDEDEVKGLDNNNEVDASNNANSGEGREEISSSKQSVRQDAEANDFSNSSEDKEETSSSRQSLRQDPETSEGDVHESQPNVRVSATGRRSEVGKRLSNESAASNGRRSEVGKRLSNESAASNGRRSEVGKRLSNESAASNGRRSEVGKKLSNESTA